jgi:inhibitor of cysteine peptidase
MKSAGASTEAMAFAREFAPNGLAYVRAFRDTGRVDIAYIEYLFRANDLDGVLLVNGTPPIIGVDDYKFLSQEDLRKNADYAALLQKYPNTNVFPADRYHTTLPSDSSSDDGWQTFRVEYLLLDGCHACARVGTLVMSFRFDSGHFAGAHVSEVRTGGDEDRPALSRRAKPGDVVTKEARLDSTEVQAKAGSSFTITLPANHTTGYSWRLAKPLNPDLLRQVSDIYSEETSGAIGAGGKEVWTFEALTKGTTELYFEYARPFEKDAAPVNTAKYKVEIK